MVLLVVFDFHVIDREDKGLIQRSLKTNNSKWTLVVEYTGIGWIIIHGLSIEMIEVENHNIWDIVTLVHVTISI